MRYFIPESSVVLLIAFLCSSVATADNHRNCHFAFGNGVTEQMVDPPGTPNIGQIRMRIGPVVVDGVVNTLVTEGFNIFALNQSKGEGRLTGFGKGTFDFGELGAFHTWEVDTVTFEGPPPYATSELIGDIRTGPARDAELGLPPMPWGTGFFANTNASLKGKGWMRYKVVNSEGTLVNEFTYYVWGWICDVDVKGIKRAQKD